MTEVIAEKVCTGCGLSKPVSEFNTRAASKKDGLQAKCKACWAVYNAQRYKRRYEQRDGGEAADAPPAPAVPAVEPAPVAAPAPAPAVRLTQRLNLIDLLTPYMPQADAADKLVALHDAQQRVLRRREVIRDLARVVADLVVEPTDALCRRAADLLIELEEVV